MFLEKRTTGQYNLKKTHILILLPHSHPIFFKETENPLAPYNILTKHFRNPPAYAFEEIPACILRGLVGIDNYSHHQHNSLEDD